MSDSDAIPRAARPFLAFVARLRAQWLHDRAGTDDRVPVGDFAAGAARPRGHPSGRPRDAGAAAASATPHTISLFRVHFLGEEAPRSAKARRRKRSASRKNASGEDEPPEADDVNESGEAATRAEALVERRFGPAVADDPLRRLGREAGRRLPRRRSYRRMRSRRGPVVDLRRTSARCGAQRRRSHQAFAAQAPGAAAQASPADRRLRLDEGANRGQSASRACAGASGAARRNLHLRHEAHAGNPADAAQATRAGARRGGPDRQGFRRRNPDRRSAAGLPRRAEICRIRPRRRDPGCFRRARARRSGGARRRGGEAVAARLAAELADAARQRQELQAADRGADRDLALRRRHGRRRFDRGDRRPCAGRLARKRAA